MPMTAKSQAIIETGTASTGMVVAGLRYLL
jgi:hypothetical protein